MSAVAVFETRRETGRYVSAKRFYDSDLFTTDNIDRAPVNGQQAGGNTNEYTFVSVVGRFNYDYKSKYMVEFAFREDGSYRYAPDSAGASSPWCRRHGVCRKSRSSRTTCRS